MEETNVTTYCENHPTVETALRCNKCGKYICAKCAVRTPTGYSCKSCIKNQQKVFDTSKPLDTVLAVVVAGVLSFMGSLVIGLLGYFIFFLAPLAGIVIAEAVRLVTGKRRSKKMFTLVVIGAIIGALPLLIFSLIGVLLRLGSGVVNFWSFLTPLYYGYYLVVTATTTYYRISGKNLRLRR